MTLTIFMNNQSFQSLYAFIKKIIDKFKFHFIKHIKAILYTVLFLIWVILFFCGYITIQRLIVFIWILCVIFLYKKLIEYANGLNNINYSLVICLINIDEVKLLFINIIVCVYIYLFDLLDNAGVLEIKCDDSIRKSLTTKGKIALFLEWVIKTFVINPFLALLYKYYSLLRT
jgi:hypothetical protein